MNGLVGLSARTADVSGNILIEIIQRNTNAKYGIDDISFYQCNPPITPTVNFGDDIYVCNDQYTGLIYPFIEMPHPVIDYDWNDGYNGPSRTGLAPGIYWLVVTDSSGTTASDTINIIETSPIIISENVNNVSCFGTDDGSIELSVSGGSPPYLYNWSNGATTSSVLNLIPGNYFVTITDTNECSVSDSVIVYQEVIPIQPNLVSGLTNVSSNANGINYSIMPVPNAVNYSWSVPPGATIISGHGSFEIVVDFGTSSGEISVVAINDCGSSLCFNFTN